MTLEEAYQLARVSVKELQAEGIQAIMKPSRSSTDPEMIAKYNKQGNISPDKWFHVTFKPIDKREAIIIHEKARYLGNLGIGFDTGGGMGERDWELDWSFRYTNKPDTSLEEARDKINALLNKYDKPKDVILES